MSSRVVEIDPMADSKLREFLIDIGFLSPAGEPVEELYSIPADTDLGDLHGRYTVPSAEKDGWDTHGLVSLNVAVMAVNMQLLRGSVKNTAAIHRRKVTAMKEALVKFGIVTALKKGSAQKEFPIAFPGGPFVKGLTPFARAFKAALGWVVVVFQVWDVAKGQKEIEESIRRAGIQTQRSVIGGKMNQLHNVNSRLTRVVSTRNYGDAE